MLLERTRLDTVGGLALSATGARLEQDVYTSELVVAGAVELGNATVRGDVRLSGATLVNEAGDALSANGLEVGASLFCRDGFTAKGNVQLVGARIGGSLDVSGAQLVRPDGWALNAKNIEIGDDLNAEGLTTDGYLCLDGADIGGEVELTGARLRHDGDRALIANRLVVAQDFVANDGFTAAGEIEMSGARIGGHLILNGATLRNPGGTALLASHLVVGDSLLGVDGLTVEGAVDLVAATIGGQLVLAGARFAAPGEHALVLDAATVARGMACDEGFTVDGLFSLSGTEVRGELTLDGATLRNPGDVALNATHLVAGPVSCGGGFRAEGQVGFSGARLTELDLTEATLAAPGTEALTASWLEVEQDLDCSGATVTGLVGLYDTRIGGWLMFDGATVAAEAGDTVELDRLRATGLSLRFATRPAGHLVLANATVGAYSDDPATLPASVDLRRFGYERLPSASSDVPTRLDWLSRNSSGFTPGIYDQLGEVYRQTGQPERARLVAIAKLRRRRAELSLPGRLWNWLLFLTVGYGYRTWLAGLWLVGLLVVGSVVFAVSYPADLVAVRSRPPRFQPIAYAVDVLLPVVDLGQQSSWAAQGPALLCSWVLIVAGWLLATLVIAGLTNALKRD